MIRLKPSDIKFTSNKHNQILYRTKERNWVELVPFLKQLPYIDATSKRDQNSRKEPISNLSQSKPDANFLKRKNPREISQFYRLADHFQQNPSTRTTYLPFSNPQTRRRDSTSSTSIVENPDLGFCCLGISAVGDLKRINSNVDKRRKSTKWKKNRARELSRRKKMRGKVRFFYFFNILVLI